MDGNYVAKPSGEGVLSEYLDGLQAVVVNSKFMQSSDLSEKLAMISEKINQQGRQSFVIDDVFARFIATAFSLPDTRAAQTFRGTTMITESDGRSINSHFFSNFKSYYQSMSWERPFFIWALNHISSDSDKDGLQIIAGLVCKAARECNSRKRFVFCAIIGSCKWDTEAAEVNTAGTAARAKAVEALHQHMDSDVAGTPGPPLGTPSEVAAAAARLTKTAFAFINDLKTKAVASTFTEPVSYYCAMMNVDAVMMDLDVHGVSSFLAMLQAATGIVTDRLPEFNDEFKGTVDVLDAKMDGALAVIWRDEHLGKGYRSLSELRLRQQTLRPQRRLPSHSFIWPCHGASTKRIADLCVNPEPRNAQHRKVFAKYVDQFCSYFTAERFLPRLVSALLSGWASEGTGAEAATADLQVVYSYMKRSGLLQGSVRRDMPTPTGAQGASSSEEESTDSAPTRQQPLPPPPSSSSSSSPPPPTQEAVVEEEEEVVVEDVRFALWGMGEGGGELGTEEFQTPLAQQIFAFVGVTKPFQSTILPIPISSPTPSPGPQEDSTSGPTSSPLAGAPSLSPVGGQGLVPVGRWCYLESALNGLVLDVKHSGVAAGTQVWMYPRNGTAAQQWRLMPFNADPSTSTGGGDGGGGGSGGGSGDGSYYVESALGLVLDVQYGNSARGANVWTWPMNGTPAQRWRVTAQGELESCLGAGMVLDVKWGNTAPQTPVWTWPKNGTPAQKWRIVII